MGDRTVKQLIIFALAAMVLSAPAAAQDAVLDAALTKPRPDINSLPLSVNATREQLLLGEKVFQGEAANGTCFKCHGRDAKGTTIGNDLTNGSLGWGESFKEIKASILNNMKLAPGQDGDLTPDDVHAVTAYVWALVHHERMDRQSSR